MLTLSRLARGLTGQGHSQGALKRVDLLLGNARIAQRSRSDRGRAAAHVCQRAELPLVIAVDWSEVAPGGAFVSCARAHAQGYGTRPDDLPAGLSVGPAGQCARRAPLLEQLRECTAARAGNHHQRCGFRRPWFTAVQRLVGLDRRSRAYASRAIACSGSMHERGLAKPPAKHAAGIKCGSRANSVLPATSCCIGAARCREALCAPRHVRAPSAPRSASQRPRAIAARALAAAPHLRPEEIVALYGLRMQIEENFRDSNDSPRHGPLVQSIAYRTTLHALLLIYTLAAFLLWHIGQLAEAEGLHLRFKATTRTARYYRSSPGKTTMFPAFTAINRVSYTSLHEHSLHIPTSPG